MKHHRQVNQYIFQFLSSKNQSSVGGQGFGRFGGIAAGQGSELHFKSLEALEDLSFVHFLGGLINPNE